MRRVISTILATLVLSIGVKTGGRAADLAPAGLTPALPAASTDGWSGFYLGGDLGGSWKRTTGAFTPLPSPAAFFALPLSGTDDGSSVIGGLHGGYNWQLAESWLMGIEADWSFARAGGSFTQPLSFFPAGPAIAGTAVTLSSRLDWVSSLRGRFGYLVTPALLAYATGGVAWARINYGASTIDSSSGYNASASVSDTPTGYAVGGGLEWAVTNHWFARAEYLFYRFNNSPSVIAPAAGFAGFPSGFSWNGTSLSVARAGLSYKF
jgi:outer membrane immunogenic protein